MKVYRIEHKDTGGGPYTACADIGARYWMSETCPGPSEDGMATWAMTYQHRFGFKYMRQMLKWFRFRDIFRMKRQGFRVYRYKIDRSEVIFGGSQVAFVRAKATVREEVPLSRLMRHMATPFVSLA